jgi:hypothetical protein
MTTDTITGPRVIQCKHCVASTRSSLDVARAAGWRMFTGVSVTGKPLDDVVCPACAGTADPEDAPQGWRVRCNTCDWEYEDDDDGPLSPAEARQMAYDHECEPEVRLAPPSGDRWYLTYELDRAGNIIDRQPARPVETINAAVLSGGEL